MIQEYRLECPGGYIKYELSEEGAVITGYGQKPYELIVPDELMGRPVTGVSKKALLGAKALKNVVLPSGVVSVGDWAFSACSNLESFVIKADDSSAGELRLGQGVFSKDNALRSITLPKMEGFGSLMAVAATVMNGEYLLKERENFLAQWDVRLGAILSEADDNDFVNTVLCGEEDLTADIDEYKEVQRRKKSGLCYLRLINDYELDKELRNRLECYLKEHTCGCESDAAFRVLLEHSEEEDYQRLLFELELVNDDNFEKALETMGERYAPLKAKLLSTHEVKKDYFDSFVL